MEASSSSESLDLPRKRRDYEKYGVGEYVAFLVRTHAIVWLVRENDKFVDLKPGEDGILRSRIFPGLWLDPAALIAGEMQRVNQVLIQSVASSEHAAFVAQSTKP